MSRIKYLLSITALLFSQQSFATAYDDDPQRFYVDGQSINDALATVNQIICFIGAMGPEHFVNDGPYKATIYEEDCETTAADASSEASSATATSASSSSTASSTSTTTASSKTATTATLNVTRLSSIAPVKTSAWVSSPAQTQEEFDMKIYVDAQQTGGVSETSPNGDFTMRFSTHADGSQDIFGGFDNFGIEDGAQLGQGYIKASGSSLKFREFGQGQENDIAATFLANGDKRGVYKEFAGFNTWDWETMGEPPWGDPDFDWNQYVTEIQAIYQFYLSAADKGYCRRLYKANEMIWPTYDEILAKEAEELAKQEADPSYIIDWPAIWAPQEVPVYNVETGVDDLSQYGDLVELELNEECFTIDRNRAQRNVHRYGVYNLDGSRLEIGNPGFPMRAEIEETLDDGNTIKLMAHAFADYWGVHVDPRVRRLVTENTAFEKEQFGVAADATAEVQQYNLKTTDIRVEKRTTSFIALNDIDGITLAMHVGDSWWADEFKALFGGTAPAYQEFEGSFDKDTSTFTLTKGINFDGGYNATDLDPVISFTTTDWQDSMFKEWGLTTVTNEDGTTTTTKEEWYHKEIRNLGVWSHDTRQWYEISAEAMADPTAATREAGIRTETNEFISPTDITETLYCIRECLDGAKVQQTFADALSMFGGNSGDQEGGAMGGQEGGDMGGQGGGNMGQGGNNGFVTSPYADVGEYLKEDVTQVRVERGFWSKSEATDGFSSTATTNSNNKIVLGKEGVATIDFVGGDRSLPLYSRAYMNYLQEGDVTGSKSGDSDTRVGVNSTLEFYSWDGFSTTNLNKLLGSSSAGDYGVAPELTIDLASIPASGASGTLKMVVSIYEGNDAENNGNEKALSAEASGLQWSSDGSNFTVTVPANTAGSMTLITSSGAAISGNFSNENEASRRYSGGQIMSGNATDDSGITLRLFQLFAGAAGIENLRGNGLGAFFEPNREYTASVVITDTDLSIGSMSNDNEEFPGVRKAVFRFRTYEDSDVTREEQYLAGQYFEGVQATDMYTYSVSSDGKVLDKNGVELKKGDEASAALLAVENPEQLLQNARYQTPDGYDTRSVAWGIRTGELVAESELPKLECRKNGKEELYDNHPVYGTDTSVTRYCGYQMWNGSVDVKYNVMLETRPTYEVVYANAVDTNAVVGEPVQIDPPKTMYLDIPADATEVYGKDAGKRIRLETNGHGNLWGIPGFVYDTKTGENLGEFVQEWKEGYRYISRFTIPDGTQIVDGVDSTLFYKVKALDGEEWLTKADGTVTDNSGNVIADLRGKYTYSGDETDLVKNRNLRNLGPEDWDGDGQNDNESYIGDEPTATVNGGETAIVHGEVVYDPTPSS